MTTAAAVTAAATPQDPSTVSAGRPLRHQTCPACGHRQELPAIFCGQCHRPLLHIPKIFLLVFLSLSFGAFAWFGLHPADMARFPFPLYAYYALVFVTFSY